MTKNKRVIINYIQQPSEQYLKAEEVNVYFLKSKTTLKF